VVQREVIFQSIQKFGFLFAHMGGHGHAQVGGLQHGGVPGGNVFQPSSMWSRM
jgi:hypothetical protein